MLVEVIVPIENCDSIQHVINKKSGLITEISEAEEWSVIQAEVCFPT